MDEELRRQLHESGYAPAVPNTVIGGSPAPTNGINGRRALHKLLVANQAVASARFLPCRVGDKAALARRARRSDDIVRNFARGC